MQANSISDPDSATSQTIFRAIHNYTETIRAHQQAASRNFYEIGKALNQVKKLLKHGEFQIWLHAEFEWTVRTANNFMSIATKIDNLPDGKKEAVSHLPQGTLLIVAASSTPRVVSEAIIARAVAGETVAPKMARKLVDAAKGKCVRPRKEPVPTTAALVAPSSDGMDLKVSVSAPMPLIALGGIEASESLSAVQPTDLTPTARARAMVTLLVALLDQTQILDLADILSDTPVFNCLRMELRDLAERLRQ